VFSRKPPTGATSFGFANHFRGSFRYCESTFVVKPSETAWISD